MVKRKEVAEGRKKGGKGGVRGKVEEEDKETKEEE